jgi:hypothetical protein
MNDDDLPSGVRKHPELAKLLQLTESNREAHEALMEFLRACEPLSREELAEVLTYGNRSLRGH